MALFTLGNSSDAFLLLRAQQTDFRCRHSSPLGVPPRGQVGGGNVGRCALGSHRTAERHRWGWIVYALSYLGFAFATRPIHVWLLFALYGLHFALCEGAERALIADLAHTDARGRAFGLFHGVSGAALLPASLLTGLLWQHFGATVALATGSALALLADCCYSSCPSQIDKPEGVRGEWRALPICPRAAPGRELSGERLRLTSNEATG